MRLKLSDRTVNQKNPPSNELWDELLPGFGLRIGARRRSYFAMTRVAGKQVRYSVGTTATHSLGEAREAARDWLRNPTTRDMRKAEASAAEREARRSKAGTFGAVAQRYLNKPGKELRTRGEIERKLEKEIPPDWNDRPIDSITRAEIRELFETKAKVAPIAANRLLGLIKTLFFFALEKDLIDANPAERIKPIDETSRDRVLEDHEIRSFWRGLESDEATIDPGLRICLKFLLATGVRRSEALFATWDEFTFEPGDEVWRIPADRSKNGHATVVPLAGLALLLLDEAEVVARGKSGNVVPHFGHVFINRYGGPFAAYSLSQAMRKSLAACKLTGDPATAHDLRRTFGTKVAKLGFPREVLKRLLNHRTKGDATDIYDRHRYDHEARVAMDAWNQRLGELIGEPAASNAVPLRAKV